MPLHTAAPGLRGGVETSSHASRDRKLMDRIKDTMFHPINEIKARKRKESPAVIDLTEPTLKRPRSASGNDIVVVGEATETSHSRSINVERHQGRPASVEPDDEQPPTRGDVTRRMLNWSRLSMKRIGSVSSNIQMKSAKKIFAGRRTSIRSFTSLSGTPSPMQKSCKKGSLQASNCDMVWPATCLFVFFGGPCSYYVLLQILRATGSRSVSQQQCTT